jgi:hypothetical protein
MGTLTPKQVSLIAGIIFISLGGWYLYGSSGGNLTSLNAANFAEFPTQFDRASNDERLLVLLSPT